MPKQSKRTQKKAGRLIDEMRKILKKHCKTKALDAFSDQLRHTEFSDCSLKTVDVAWQTLGREILPLVGSCAQNHLENYDEQIANLVLPEFTVSRKRTVNADKSVSEITVKLGFVPGSVQIVRPTKQEGTAYVKLTEEEARRTGVSLNIGIWASLQLQQYEQVGENPPRLVKTVTNTGVDGQAKVELIATLPALTGSWYTHEALDIATPRANLGGQIVLNGRVVVIPYQTKNKRGIPVLSANASGKQVTINSTPPKGGASKTYTIVYKNSDKCVYVNMRPFQNKSSGKLQNIPILAFMLALGFAPREVFELVKAHPLMNALLPSTTDGLLNDDKVMVSQQDALNFLAKTMGRNVMTSVANGTTVIDEQQMRVTMVHKILLNELIPHQANAETLKSKGLLVIEVMLIPLLEYVCGIRDATDRDDFSNKVLQSAGDQFKKAMLSAWLAIGSDAAKQFRAKTKGSTNVYEIPPDLLSTLKLTARMNGDISRLANVGSVGGESGISQPLERATHAAEVAHISTIKSKIGNNNTDAKATMIDSRQLGFKGEETGDGAQNCGTKGIATIQMRLTTNQPSSLMVLETVLSNMAQNLGPPFTVAVKEDGKQFYTGTVAVVKPLVMSLFNQVAEGCCKEQGGSKVVVDIDEYTVPNVMRLLKMLEAPMDSLVVTLAQMTNDPIKYQDHVRIYLNNTLHGCAEDHTYVQQYIQLLKKRNALHHYVTEHFDPQSNSLHVFTTGGRPVYLAHKLDGNSLLKTDPAELLDRIFSGEVTTIEDILRKWPDAFEYLDAAKQEHCLVAVNASDLTQNTEMREAIATGKAHPHAHYKEYTHMLVHPIAMYGPNIAQNPLMNHTAGARNIFSSSQRKQAIDTKPARFNEYVHDKNASALCPFSGCRSNCYTFTQDYFSNNPKTPFDNPCNGYLVNVAFMPLRGNVEDASVVSSDLIERGFGWVWHYTTVTATLDISTHTEHKEQFTRPDPDIVLGTKPEKLYAAIQANGLPVVGTRIEKGHVVIGKIKPNLKKTQRLSDRLYTHRDGSIMMKKHAYGEVISVDQDTDNKGWPRVRVKLRTLVKPTIGDKLSNPFGQKGVIGEIIPAREMPFDAHGERPDIIVNPAALPTRATISMLLTGLFNLISKHTGQRKEATAFQALSHDCIKKQLKDAGLREDGCRIMFNGVTGVPFKMPIFMAPIYYYRLPQMADGKMYARGNEGPVTHLRQPTEGRRHGGGLRLGVMEGSCLKAHGAASFLHNAFTTTSDGSQLQVCDWCDRWAHESMDGGFECLHCPDNRTDFTTVDVPYAFKHMTQILNGMHMHCRVKTTNSKEK